jgi:Protein of unknown function (DUF2946)
MPQAGVVVNPMNRGRPPGPVTGPGATFLAVVLESPAVTTFRRHLLSISWLALLAMCALALAPTVSHALAKARGSTQWTEVCTPQGMRLVALDAQTTPEQQPAVGGHLEHCPWCGVGSISAGMPPAPPAVLPPAQPLRFVPPLFLQARQTPFVWAPAQPRGPPATA